MHDVIYLDNAATSFPKPDLVHDRMMSFYRTCGVNPGRSGCDMALEAEHMVSGCRRKLSEFFNASLVGAGKKKDPDRLVFTLNATHSLNLILRGTVEGGQSIWGRALRLEWLSSALFYVIDRLTGLLRAAASVFEGEGGLLWTVIVIVVVVVIYTGALQ